MPSLKHANSTAQGTRRTVPLMGTLVSIEIVGSSPEAQLLRSPEMTPDVAIDRALDWFHRVEACCTRFDPQSELMQLCARAGEAISVSPLLFELVQFALAVAHETNGAFDPTVGRAMEARGFNCEYRSGKTTDTALNGAADGPATYRDVSIDAQTRTILLSRPLVLDPGAVAKGFAVDLAARELQAFKNFAIDAGGDLFLSGHNASGEKWSVGIRHPRAAEELLGRIRVSNQAVCTSGDYERHTPTDSQKSHILDPRVDGHADRAASVTVVAPTTMFADALSTAAFVLGAREGVALLERMGVEGLIVTPSLEQFATKGFCLGR